MQFVGRKHAASDKGSWYNQSNVFNHSLQHRTVLMTRILYGRREFKAVLLRVSSLGRVSYTFFVKRDWGDFLVKREFKLFIYSSHDFKIRVNVKDFWILFVTREKAQYFYVVEFCKGV